MVLLLAVCFRFPSKLRLAQTISPPMDRRTAENREYHCFELGLVWRTDVVLCLISRFSFGAVVCCSYILWVKALVILQKNGLNPKKMRRSPAGAHFLFGDGCLQSCGRPAQKYRRRVDYKVSPKNAGSSSLSSLQRSVANAIDHRPYAFFPTMKRAATRLLTNLRRCKRLKTCPRLCRWSNNNAGANSG